MKMGCNTVSVALTPNGNADAVVRSVDGAEYFVEPYTEKMTMEQLLSHLEAGTNDANEVAYLQSQNGNLYSPQTMDNDSSELETLRLDVPPDVPWATETFGYSPDAVNIWVGDSRSMTSVHSDPYENIYTVIRGFKHFILFPPTEGHLLVEKPFPRATYIRLHPRGPLILTPVQQEPSPASEFQPPLTVSWATMDPALPIEGTMPLRVTLCAGETLYLPAGWWHHVTQSGEEEGGRGAVIAANWWYDMEMRGDRWVWLSALRRLSQKGETGNAAAE